MLDLSEAGIVYPPSLSGIGERAIAMLVEEVEARTRLRWPTSTAWPSTDVPVIAVAPTSALSAFTHPYATELAVDQGLYSWVKTLNTDFKLQRALRKLR